MTTLTKTAQRARDLRAQQHRDEIEALLVRGQQWKEAFWTLAGLLVALLAAVALSGVLAGWHTEKPPVETKLRVVVYGWMDKDGAWRSYDTGQKMEAQSWRP